jgi:nanoRNase/pAp phosphatase (c-di-AMP/oligoRNAs hydrolase)
MSDSQFTAQQEHALELLRTRERFLLVGHVRPDGDCVGSQGALAAVLRGLGKEVTILNPDDPGPSFSFFAEGSPFHVYREGEPVPEHDVTCLLDINELSRCGAMAKPLAQAATEKLVIDHHLFEGQPWWDAAFVDEGASATGILVWRIASALGVPNNLAFAHAVFTAIVTDTGWFKYSNTDVETMRAVSRLVEMGVDPSRVFAWLYQDYPPEQPAGVAALLGRLAYFDDQRLAVVDQPRDLRGPVDSEAVLDILRAVGSVEVVLYLKEVEPGLCKLSARSKTAYDVNALCRRFDGGGHRKASGATIRGALADVRERIIAAAREGFAGGSGTREKTG